MKVIRLPYKNGRVAEDYFVELVGYITIEKFQRRIATLNDVIIQHGVSRGLLMLPILLVWLTIVIVVPISIKRQSEPQILKDKNSSNPLVNAMLVIFFSLVAACVIIVTMVRKANHRKLAALRELLATFNADDNRMYINWRISNDSGCQIDEDAVGWSRTSAEQCLIIEVGIVMPMLEVAVGGRAMRQFLHDSTAHSSLSPPPPYEVALKDPPPALTPTWQTPQGSIMLPQDPASIQTSHTLNANRTNSSFPQQIT